MPTPPPRQRDELEAWGPTVEGRVRRRGGRRTTLIVLLLLAPLVYAALLATTMSSAMARSDVTALSGDGSGPMHVLVTGSDSREGLSDEERRELTTGSAAGERTDTIFVLTIDGGRAAMLAFPRDLWVTRCDGSTGRINAALSVGGMDCLVDTIEEMSGIGLDHQVAVSFGGFRSMVDAVGGVEMCLDDPIADPKAGIDLQAGCQNLDGANALGYVRTRQLDNDLERIKRQQEFLGALAGELATPATVLNPLRAFDTARSVGGSMTVDRGLGMIDLARLGLGGRALAGGAAVTETVPATGASVNGASVLMPDEGAAEEVFARFRSGRVLEEAVPDEGASPTP